MKRLVCAMLCFAILAMRPDSVRGQDLAGVSVRIGKIRPSGSLRIIPYGRSNGGDTRTHLSASTFAAVAVAFGTPLEVLKLELAAGSSAGSRLMKKELAYSSCGPNCTRGVEESFPIGQAQMVAGGIDMVLSAPWIMPMNLAGTIGAGAKRLSFDTEALGEHADAFGGDETRPYWSYGLRAGPDLSPRFSIDLGLQILHSTITTNIRASDNRGMVQIESPQSDWIVYAGLRLRT